MTDSCRLPRGPVLFQSVFGGSSGSEANPVPTIQFPNGSSDSGAFSIPVGQDKRVNYTFSLSSNDDVNGPQGSFECLSSEPNRTLVSLGNIPDKLHVQASDDAYKRFGQKMIEVNEEKNKRTTQLLEQNVGKGLVASKAKFVRKSRPLLPAPSNKIIPQNRLRDPGGGGAGGGLLGGGLPQRTRSPTTSSASSNFLSDSHPMLNRSPQGGRSSMPYNKPHSDIMKRPLKERIIHLLAVRPYKKPELLSRVTRDGIREKDRKNITMILKQVSVMKDNSYYLLRHIWNDVSEDWPYYSEQERQSFRRRKPQNLTPPFSDGSTSSSGHSPSSTHAASPPSSISPNNGTGSPSGLKRGASFYEAVAAKKQRVSTFVKAEDRNSPRTKASNSPFRATPTFLSRNGGSPALRGLGDENDSVMNNYYGGEGGPAVSNCDPPNGHKQNSWDYTPTSSPENHGRNFPPANNKCPSPPVEASTDPRPPPPTTSSVTSDGQRPQRPPPPQAPPAKPKFDFLKEFVKVVTAEQRNRYKKEFNANYETYRKLHALTTQVPKRAVHLENKLKQEAPGSDARLRLESKIVNVYKESRQIKEKYQYLHSKLAHIKKLVSDYDNAAKSNSGSS
eukprot:maker-scaffold276_size226481-snap-gene-1.27 protein:Tk04709 transcript:maker-scaffold276_size226481-snap-gene-1.27-mRNA-1 annotation:"rna polymerase ii elongation factor ell"